MSFEILALKQRSCLFYMHLMAGVCNEMELSCFLSNHICTTTWRRWPDISKHCVSQHLSVSAYLSTFVWIWGVWGQQTSWSAACAFFNTALCINLAFKPWHLTVFLIVIFFHAYIMIESDFIQYCLEQGMLEPFTVGFIASSVANSMNFTNFRKKIITEYIKETFLDKELKIL